jgi:hypothetical protein
VRPHPNQKKLGVVVCAFIPAIGSINRSMVLKVGQSINLRLYSKKNKAKKQLRMWLKW